MMRKTFLTLSIAGLTVLASADAASAQVLPTATLGKYASERSPHRFAGATRVVLDKFDAMDKDAKSARLQLDNNDVSYSEFGEEQITVVFYKSFQVDLTRLNGADPDGRERRIFAVELPKEYAAALEGSTLRLVTRVGATSELRGVRLLLLNPQSQVTATLELRSSGAASLRPRFSISHERLWTLSGRP
jgi:hypothetical protein